MLPTFLLLFIHISLASPFRQRSALPTDWYHDDDHPVHTLFKRAPPTDGTTYPAVGSPEWRSRYPSGPPDPAQVPREWSDALNAAQAAGRIPNIPLAMNTGGNPAYPNNLNAFGPEICSSTAKCRAPGDIWDAPTGVIGTGFDDGPVPEGGQLYDFLQRQNQRVTHFMIGINILNNPQPFLRAYDTLNGDIAVHTYTHPYMTTQTNQQIVAQLGWTMQIIHDSTGGRVPRYWRPPYGDADNRVRAIAKEVFGMDAILWNQDTRDWSVGSANGTTTEIIANQLRQWIAGPKTPGLIILQHELTTISAQAFIAAYPDMISHGWNLTSAARLGRQASPYANTDASNANVLVDDILAANPPQGSASSSSTETPEPTNTFNVLPTGTQNASSNPKSGASSIHPSSWTILCLILSLMAGL